METELWLPFVLAFASQVVTFLILWAMPETNPNRTDVSKHNHDSGVTTTEDNETHDVDSLINSNDHIADGRSLLERLRQILNHRGLVVIFTFFILKRIAFTSASETFIYQYTSEKFNMRLSQIYPVRVTYIAGAVAINLVILPLITRLWRPQRTYLPSWDLNITKACLSNGTIGFIIIWRALRFSVLCFGTVK
jgi:hypothetical protein